MSASYINNNILCCLIKTKKNRFNQIKITTVNSKNLNKNIFVSNITQAD